MSDIHQSPKARFLSSTRFWATVKTLKKLFNSLDIEVYSGSLPNKAKVHMYINTSVRTVNTKIKIYVGFIAWYLFGV